MKLIRSIIATVIITLSAFGAFVYTSCTKDKCAKIVCQNGGSCSNGFCTCPRGHTGDFCEIPATSNIQYFNHSFTDLTLTLNNVAYVIHPGYSKGFTGNFGDSLNGNAFTKGPYGEQINWDTVSNVFGISGTQNVYFDVSPRYFFVTVQNDSASSVIREVIVNRTLPTEADIILPPPYLTYALTTQIGYFYLDSATSNVYVKSKTNWGFNNPAPLYGITSTGLDQKYDVYAQ